MLSLPKEFIISIKKMLTIIKDYSLDYVEKIIYKSVAQSFFFSLTPHFSWLVNFLLPIAYLFCLFLSLSSSSSIISICSSKLDWCDNNLLLIYKYSPLPSYDPLLPEESKVGSCRKVCIVHVFEKGVIVRF